MQAASNWNSFERAPQSAAPILLSTSALALAKQSSEETSDGLAGSETQAVLSSSTVKRFLEANKLPHKEGHHAALPLTCPLCERETSQTVFINKTTRDWCALRARSTVSGSALVDRVHGAVVYPCTYARMCVYVCVCRT